MKFSLHRGIVEPWVVGFGHTLGMSRRVHTLVSSASSCASEGYENLIAPA